jgi:hypoxanthine phosphoribosyltransferase
MPGTLLCRGRALRYSHRMRGDVDRILIPQERIAQRVRELAERITADLARDARDNGTGGENSSGTRAGGEITIVPVLTGAMIFCADLIRHIPVAMRIGLLAVSSYPGRSLRTQGSQLLGQQLGDLTGRSVLLVDDILDSGGTLRMVQSLLEKSGAARVRSCVLLRKDRPSARDVHVDYVGFEIPDQFVVGYGLDFNNYYRNLPDIVTLTAEAVEGRRERTVTA